MFKKKKIIYSILILLFFTGLITYLSIGTNILAPYNNPEAGCANCIKQVGMAMRMYSNRYNEHFPAGKDTPLESLGLLIEDGFLRDAHCLTSHAKSWELTQYYKKHKKIPEELMCYKYNEGLTESASCDHILLYYKKPIKWCCYMHPKNTAGRLILFVDGHCKFHPEAEFQKMQKDTLEWIKKNQKTVAKNGIIAFIQRGGTLWTLDKDNYLFVRDGKVTWWGNASEWKKHIQSGNKSASPRDVTKAPNPERKEIPKEEAKYDLAYWQEKVNQVKLGMTRAEVEKLLPCRKADATGFTGGAYEIHYWVDDNWMIKIGYDYSGDDRDENGRGPGNKVLGLPKLKAEKRKVYKVKK